MLQSKPLWHRLFFEAHYTEVCRAVGYAGITYRQLTEVMEELGKKFGKEKVQSAVYHCVTFEGQHATNVKPLTHVSLRSEVRKLCSFLGPPPETWDSFYRFPNGQPRPEHAEKMAQLGKKPEPEKKPRKAKK